MPDPIQAIHHITAIADDAQTNLDFYVGILGLRLVKRTVNFDDPGTYHFYFADHAGTPGTILTFFPWRGAARGRRGSGQATVTSFAVPASSLDWWEKHLIDHGVELHPIEERFDESVMTFEDPDGLLIELVASPEHDSLATYENAGFVPEHASIRGFHGSTLCVSGYETTAKLLTEVMGLTEVGHVNNRFRFRTAGRDLPGQYVDVLCSPDAPHGSMGVGTVHHVAFRVPGDAAQTGWREELAKHGFNPTPILDRQYFHSIYFREPGGIIFEFATDPPGFATDEDLETLGGHLKLPEWLEPNRTRIESMLPTIKVPEANSGGDH